MTLRNLQQKFSRRTGSTVQQVLIESWKGQGKPRPIILSIEFSDGPIFALSCSGAGGIAIRKGCLPPVSKELELRTIDELSGDILKSVIIGDDHLDLSFSDSTVRLINNDDNLEILFTKWSDDFPDDFTK
ncbi:hypothetical protein [Planctomicrobium sp. SH664]|uniref:hypothetical protein n=1 Tax=Planctomicrobium sp. SH664 TaxID=3448125 RepID=UPI003F5C70D5